MKPSLIIVGLGNPGASYEATRHNTGFMALDKLREAFGTSEWRDQPKFLSVTAEARIVAAPLLLVKPQTYMNRSGEAVRKLLDFYHFDPAHHLLVISDDVDLPIGEIRFRMSGRAGTHNGLKSVVEHAGEIFPRLRLGIGRQKEGEDLATYVLSSPPPEERRKIEEAIAGIPELVRRYVLENATEQ